MKKTPDSNNLHIPHPGYQSKEVRDFLALFGPYLAYQPLVYCPGRNRYGRLLGLPYTRLGERPAADVVLFQTEAERKEEVLFDIDEPVSNLLPVLRGFEDLPDELLTGEVPAVRLVEIGSPHLKAVTATAENENEIHIKAAGVYCSRLFKCDFEAGAMGLRQTEYLRRNLFAAGLRPDQFHRNSELLRFAGL